MSSDASDERIKKNEDKPKRKRKQNEKIKKREEKK